MNPPIKGLRLTGSRLFGVATEASDWDWFSDRGPCPINRDGWSMVAPYGPGDGFIVLRRGRQNIICATSFAANRAWEAAERHCMIERPFDKSRRRVIFDHFLYGMPLDRWHPIRGECRKMWRNVARIAFLRDDK